MHIKSLPLINESVQALHVIMFEIRLEKATSSVHTAQSTMFAAI